jgi:Fe-S oxidoreductase
MNALETIKRECLECPLCQKECRFLQKYGTPKAIADQFNPAKTKFQILPFECSLCGLCSAVCPVGLNPVEMFLEMRRTIVRQGGGQFAKYAPLLKYEKRGTSKRYTYYGFPDHCHTILFPGCALAGTRPDKVMKVYQSIKESIPNLGVVLDCCTKPSHDLGREDYFQTMFGEIKSYLVTRDIQTILVACPNCYQIFKNFGHPLQVKTIYEILAEIIPGGTKKDQRAVTVHDPCVTRFENPVQEAVRNLILSQDITIEEMEHQRANTLCCGEGGAVGFLAPDLAMDWSRKIKQETHGKRILTYCAGCTSNLNKLTPTDHVLDLLYDPEGTLKGKAKVSRSPVTYWNRLRLKNRFRKIISSSVSRGDST